MELPFVPGWRVERVRRWGACGLTISARSRRDAARCPDCRHRSTAVHGYYRRRPTDLPLLGFRVRLELRSAAVLLHDHRAVPLICFPADTLSLWLRDVRQRYLVGETLLAIARATGFARSTVRKNAHPETFPERAARAPGPSMIDPYLPYLEAMLVDGGENASELWREIAKRGYAGTKKSGQSLAAGAADDACQPDAIPLAQGIHDKQLQPCAWSAFLTGVRREDRFTAGGGPRCAGFRQDA